MKLKVLSMEDCEQVRLWRNECLYALRTPYPLTKEQQEEFYRNTVCNRDARARYWGVTTGLCEDSRDSLIGMVGIENIEWENRRGEISIIINPEWQHAGMGTQSVDMLLEKGFNELNLDNVWGVVYEGNPAEGFWVGYCSKFGKDDMCILRDMKYWDGKYWYGSYFNINKEEWNTCHKL